MTKVSIEKLQVEPYFDLEFFLSTSQETRIGGDTMERISQTWERWLAYAYAFKLTASGREYLLVWLDGVIEDEVDSMWDKAPADAFLFNALAQVMCMGLIHALLPEVEDAGCAPAPYVTDDLCLALEQTGVPYSIPGEPGLVKRYAVVTYMPFKGGCEICALRSGCPRASGCKSVPLSIELPGFK